MWDYLIVTAANEKQAEAYRQQLDLRERLGLIQGFRNILVVPDKDGKRIGSGGSTILCLLEVLNRELQNAPDKNNREKWQSTLDDQRLLIIHAGGDARRLPPYSPCGKIFVPLPTETDTVLTETIFDRQLPTYSALPRPRQGVGQTVITSGDVLLDFDPRSVQFNQTGMTGLASYAEPDLAANHGVYCTDTNGAVTRFLQKPTVEEQEELGAIDRYGRTLLDIGVFQLSSDAATRLLNVFEPKLEGDRLVWSGPLAESTMNHSLDFYREIACALGTETTFEDFEDRAKSAGSNFATSELRELHGALAEPETGSAPVPLQVEKLGACQFLHFGTPRQILESGTELLNREAGIQRRTSVLVMNSGSGTESETAFQAVKNGSLSSSQRSAPTNHLQTLITSTGPAWIEGCSMDAPIQLEGDNVLTGVVFERIEDPSGSGESTEVKSSDAKRLWSAARIAAFDEQPEDYSDDSVILDSTKQEDLQTPENQSPSGESREDSNIRKRCTLSGTPHSKDRSERSEDRYVLNKGQCLDIVPAVEGGYYIRPYHIDDLFNQPAETGTYCGIPLTEWMEAIGATEKDLWDPSTERSLWTAKLFTHIQNPTDFGLWVFDPEKASDQERRVWRAAPRFSCAEIAAQTDQKKFYNLRNELRAQQLTRSFRNLFRKDFSAAELAYLLEELPTEVADEEITKLVDSTLKELESDEIQGLARLELSRILHTVATALELTNSDESHRRERSERHSCVFTGTGRRYSLAQLKNAAFDNLSQTIILGDSIQETSPRVNESTSKTAISAAIRSDEIVWSRAPARLDLGGGWTDTPPYSLENGGAVLNVAVDLNGQPPIHAYARLCSDPVIKITSIDHGVTVTIETWEDLLNYDLDGFGLAKAALAQTFGITSSGREAATPNPAREESLTSALDSFGGGIELTTLAAIPSGSGLGTSSIMGAVLISALDRLCKRSNVQRSTCERANVQTCKRANVEHNLGTASQRTLFNRVLQLEQALTSGGGWQDQIGGVVEELKLITSPPGLIPDPRIHFVPHDLIDPAKNGGQTLLYYTGIRRLAKNILKEIVGRYLNRDRETLDVLRRLHSIPQNVAEALAQKDIKRFGTLIAEVWTLNKSLDPGSTTPEIEDLSTRINDKIYGAKLLGAGGGGFLFIICRSEEDTRRVRNQLEADPVNDKARFFDYSISNHGLQVTVC